MIPALTPVQSSNIKEMGHDGQESAAYVRFHNGQLWRYHGVPKHVYDEWLGSGSVGRYHHQFVKPNHRGEKVE